MRTGFGRARGYVGVTPARVPGCRLVPAGKWALSLVTALLVWLEGERLVLDGT